MRIKKIGSSCHHEHGLVDSVRKIVAVAVAVAGAAAAAIILVFGFSCIESRIINIDCFNLFDEE